MPHNSESPAQILRSTLRTPRRDPPTLPRHLPLAGTIRHNAILVVQVVRLDVLHHGLRDEVPDAHVAAAEEADFCGRDVVLHELLDHPDVVFPGLEGREGFVDVGAGAL